MIAVEHVLKALDKAYSASYGETPWEDALGQLADAFDHSVATLEFHDTAKRQLLSIETARINPVDMTTYVRDFATRNPRVRFQELTGANVLFDQLCFNEQDMDHDAFYADFLAPRKLRYFLSTETKMVDRDVKAVISLQRPGTRSGADEEAIRLMSALQPHLARVCDIYWRQLRLKLCPELLDQRLASYHLTGAERNLARAIILKEPLKNYAARKGLSMNTVYTHYRHLKEKLDCAGQAALALRLTEIAKGDELRLT